MKNVLGISIGTKKIKISEVVHHELADFVSVDVPEKAVGSDESVTAWSGIGDLLRSVKREHHFHTKDCALVLPDGATYVRRMNLPAMNEKQLAVNLPYEFRDVLAQEPDKYLFDYSMIDVQSDENNKPTEMDLIGATVSKELIENYTNMFAKAGFHLVKASPRVMCLGDLLKRFGTAASGDFALLDLGPGYTRIDIFHDGIYEVTRSIDTGVNEIVNAAASVLNCDVHIAEGYLNNNKDGIQSNASLINVYDSIAVQIMRALNYYTYENRDNTLEKLYYCGAGSSLDPFLEEIRGNISLQLEPLSSFDPEHGEALMLSPSSAGIALGE